MSASSEPGEAAVPGDEPAAGSGPVPAVAALAAVDPAALSGAGRIDALIALEALKSWADAQQQRLFAAMTPPGDPNPRRLLDERQWVREEIACALRLPPGAVNARLHIARELRTRLPDTLALLETGALTLRHAALLAEAVTRLDDDACAAVQARVLPRAAEQTVPQFRRAVTRAVIAADPRTAADRHTTAIADRRVLLRIQDDAMAEICALLPAEDAMALMTRIDADAATRTPGDDRTVDQRRADALTNLAHTPPASTPTNGDDTAGDAAAADTTAENAATGDTTTADTPTGDTRRGCKRILSWPRVHGQD